jgi:hypothetical protein
MKLSFTTTIKTLPVEIDGKTYTLKELNGTQRDSYLTDNAGRQKWVKGEIAGIKDLDQMQAKLIHLSLFDTTGKQVPLETIQSWPASTVSGLFDAARDLSKLGKEKEPSEEDKAKNG